MKLDIKGYEGLYFITKNSEIYSYPKKTRKGIRLIKPMLLKNGYIAVDLCKNGKIKKHLVHRLMCETFYDNTLFKEQVNHINGIKTDNRLVNLEWATRSENQLHSIKLGLRTAKGIKNSQSKLTEKEVMEIFKDKREYKFISIDYNISVPTISDIKRGHTWTHITKNYVNY